MKSARLLWFPNEEIWAIVEVAANYSNRGLGEMQRINQREYGHIGYHSHRLHQDVWSSYEIVHQLAGGLKLGEVEHKCKRATMQVWWSPRDCAHFCANTTACEVVGRKLATSINERTTEERGPLVGQNEAMARGGLPNYFITSRKVQSLATDSEDDVP